MSEAVSQLLEIKKELRSRVSAETCDGENIVAAILLLELRLSIIQEELEIQLDAIRQELSSARSGGAKDDPG